jgi:hypothetical protein
MNRIGVIAKAAPVVSRRSHLVLFNDVNQNVEQERVYSFTGWKFVMPRRVFREQQQSDNGYESGNPALMTHRASFFPSKRDECRETLPEPAIYASTAFRLKKMRSHSVYPHSTGAVSANPGSNTRTSVDNLV